MMNFKYYKAAPLIAIILLLAGAIDFLLQQFIVTLLMENGIEFLRAPGNAAIIGSFFILYDQYLWKIPFFNLLVKIPNINGRYAGKIKYVFNAESCEKECIVEVKQTASKIKIQSYFSNEDSEKTGSKSAIEEIQKAEDGFFDVYFFYQNTGSKLDGILDSHEGANKLRYFPGTKNKKAKLAGHYFTNRLKQTRGEIKVSFVSNKLKGEF